MVNPSAAVLQVYDLLPGKYTFNLNVTNVRGKVGSDSVNVIVKDNTSINQWVSTIP